MYVTGNIDIGVNVQSQFIWHESDPSDLRYVFAYTITITNNGLSKSQLLKRHWLITNGDGHQEEVDGPGVVGKQPMLAPGESFCYTSGTILETPFGTMEGHYEFAGVEGNTFKVPIAPFILSIPEPEIN